MTPGPPPPSPTVVETGNSVIFPANVMRPILLAPYSVNHSAPSGPAAMPRTCAEMLESGNSVSAPAAVIRPTLDGNSSVNQMLQSGPTAIDSGLFVDTGSENSVN